MKKSMSVLSMFMAGAMVAGGAGLTYADDLQVSGFADIVYTVSDESSDVAGGKNPSELKFGAEGEIDLEKKVDKVTVRLDVDVYLDDTATGDAHDSADIEQAKFNYAIGGELNFNLEAGVFNSPIGFEAQDAPDMYQISHGQLFDLTPANLAGANISASMDMASLNVLYVNPVNGQSEENSIGGVLSLTPMPELGINVGYLTEITGGAVAGADTGDLFDVVVTGTVMPSSEMSLTYAVEYLDMESIDNAFGLTANVMHGHHGLTIRYDMVNMDNNAPEPTTLTIALLCEPAENLGVVLEWKDIDRDGERDGTGALVADGSTIQLEFVAKF